MFVPYATTMTEPSDRQRREAEEQLGRLAARCSRRVGRLRAALRRREYLSPGETVIS